MLEDEKLFELRRKSYGWKVFWISIKKDFAKNFAKCCNLFIWTFCFARYSNRSNWYISIPHDKSKIAKDTKLMNKNLKLNNWAFQWNMCFNPDLSNQAQEIIFNRIEVKSSHQIVYLNNIPASSTSVHEHLGMFLDEKLSYKHHLKFLLNKVQKTIDLLCKFQKSLPRQSWNTIYKSFIQPHLDVMSLWVSV